MFRSDEEIKAGDLLTFTQEVELHLADLRIEHRFEYGDDILVLDRDDDRKFNVLITNPLDLTWQAWIFLVIAEGARDFRLNAQELYRENEGVSSPLPLNYWNQTYRNLTPQERHKYWQEQRDEGETDYNTLWKLLVNSPQDRREQE